MYCAEWLRKTVLILQHCIFNFYHQIFHLSDGLKTNYVLNELYLQNNKLVDIKGCLHHLTCLQTLLLQSNQLTSLADVIHEFRHMGNLKILSKLYTLLFLLDSFSSEFIKTLKYPLIIDVKTFCEMFYRDFNSLKKLITTPKT